SCSRPTMTIKEFLVSFLMPEKCYETFFVDTDLEMLESIMKVLLDPPPPAEQLPQLLKILWRRSAAGLSLTSALLQLYACSCPVLYAAANSFPLYSWGERLLTLVQSVAIVFLIVHYRELAYFDCLHSEVFLIHLCCFAVVLSNYIWMDWFHFQGFQARMNHINGHTGQLSSASVLLSCAGSLDSDQPHKQQEALQGRADEQFKLPLSTPSVCCSLSSFIWCTQDLYQSDLMIPSPPISTTSSCP
uniref:Mannose-P-dolichol utilization defect 1a n=1 Tax=Takifugu rubripes TaxID=31033 RepID=A0A674NS49_TAKRU